MSEDTSADTGGEVRSDEAPSDIRDPADSSKSESSNAIETSATQNIPFMVISPLPSSATCPHSMAATVEDVEDEGDHLLPLSPTRPELPTASQPINSPSLTHFTTSTATNFSGSSGGSGRTVVSRAPVDRIATENGSRDAGYIHTPRQQHQPDTFNYVDPESPELTEKAIQEARWRQRRLPSQPSPSMRSPSSSVPSYHTEVFSEHNPDGNSFGSWSPGQAAPGGSLGFVKLNGNHQPAQHLPQPSHYPTPYANFEMGRGNNNVPHLPSGPLPPRFAGPEHAGPPRVENLPLTGYQLVAAKLAGGIHGPPVRPIYRHFGALNHRILLHLQDEIAELEEHLQGLDMADTQARRLSGNLRASRRTENLIGGDLFRRKTEVLGNIGFKLHQYNQVMMSFKETQKLLVPSMADIHDYRCFLTASCAVVDDETRFLDAADDLVSLAHPPLHPQKPLSDDGLTPMPRPAGETGFPPGRPMSSSSAYSTSWRSSLPPAERVVPATLAQLALGMFVALLVPILTFAVIPGFVGRMTAVLLVGLGVGTAMAQSGLVRMLSTSERGYLDCMVYVGVYGGLMAVVAGTFN